MADIFYAQVPDRRRIIELSDQGIGPNYLKEEHFEEHETFLVAIEGHFIVGFAGCVVNKGIGNINSVAVDPEYKRRGIGTDLVYNCLVHLWNLGVRRVESQGWERCDNKVVGIRSSLLANGFKEYAYDKDFYVTDEETDEECILCGRDCKCGAFLFELQMGDEPPKPPKRKS